MGTHRRWSRIRAGVIALALLTGISVGCTPDEEEPTEDDVPKLDAVQDSPGATAQMGVGIIRPIALDVPGSFEPEDAEIYIRSFDSEACDILDTQEANPLGADVGFEWSIWMHVPRADLEEGKKLDFDEFGDCADCLLVGIETQHMWPEPLDEELSWSGGTSGDCNADYHQDEEPSHLEVVSLDEAGATIRITNLCVLDWNESDEPIVYSLDGDYRLQRCAANPPTGPEGG